MSKNISKSRNFAFILYPESLPNDWEHLLSMKLDTSMAISPIHNKDVSSIKGRKYKKPHYHAIYIAHNPVTVESVRKKIKRALGNNSVTHVEIVDNVENYFKYLTHESSDAIKKHKHLYNKKDITYINGFDIDRYITLDDSQKKAMRNVLLTMIRENNIVNIFDLYDFIECEGSKYGIKGMSYVNDIIESHTAIFRLYFDGAYQKQQRKNKINDVNK